jgi:hypothetical protein
LTQVEREHLPSTGFNLYYHKDRERDRRKREERERENRKGNGWKVNLRVQEAGHCIIYLQAQHLGGGDRFMDLRSACATHKLQASLGYIGRL